jgi:hypothetical protein
MSLIDAIESKRNSNVLIYGASSLEMDSLPILYDALKGFDSRKKLDVVLYCRGGVVNAARRIALLFHEFTDHLCFIIPHHCESAGTITILSSHEIIAGPVAIFSPIDPLLQSSQSVNDSTPSGISSLDIKLFNKVGEDWFGMSETQAKSLSFTSICENIFPTTLTSFYRSTLEVRDICLELLSLKMTNVPYESKMKIIESLLFSYHSHSYALSRDDLRNLGLPLQSDVLTENVSWEISRYFRHSIGAAARISANSEWFDAVIATRFGAKRRRQTSGLLLPLWEDCEFE